MEDINQLKLTEREWFLPLIVFLLSNLFYCVAFSFTDNCTLMPKVFNTSPCVLRMLN